MTEQQGRHRRRLRLQPSPVLPEDRHETAASVLPDVPRVGALDALLREVDSLRLTLETDLTLAAAAVENGAPQVAVDIIDSDRDGLAAFERRALGHVADLARPRRRRLRVPAAPFVAAAAVAGFLIGVVPHLNQPTQTDATNASQASATDSYNKLVTATQLGESIQAVAASNTLHAQLLAVVAQAQSNPGAALSALQLLTSEQNLLASVGTASPALARALAASQLLSSQIRQALTPTVRTSVSSPPAVHVVVPPSPRPTQSPSSKPSPKPSSSARPQPASSSQPSPSSSPSSGSGLPGAPGFS
jgi:hypothetical protein